MTMLEGMTKTLNAGKAMCQASAPGKPNFYVPCGVPATMIVELAGVPYFMCERCGGLNVGNGAKALGMRES